MNNLPIQLNRFIGRQREIAEVQRLLSESHLVTLTGPGGCGKTRLALEVATQLLDAYDDGVWWIELAPLVDSMLVPQAVAAPLDVREQPDRPILHALVDTLRPKNILLVLDNCEHLIDACAQLSETLLRACANLQILATSREALNIAGENAWMVPSLSLPEVGEKGLTFAELSRYEAVQLFVDRAVAVQPNFRLTELNAQAVVQVCQRLDGIPLAIELAAARAKVLQSAEIAKRLDDRFNFLTNGGRSALPRHQTLRAAIGWSYDLLTRSERVLLRRLAVFVDGCTLAAVEQVCCDEVGKIHESALQPTNILDLLSHLVDKSLVIVDEQSGDTRYHMLETIRQYADERLRESGEANAVQARHSDWFVNFAEQAEPNLEGFRQTEWLGQLRREYSNLRAALVWSLGNDLGIALRLVSALVRFWEMRGHLFGEPILLLEKVLSTGETPGQMGVRAKALGWLGQFKYLQADYGGALSAYEKALALYEELKDKYGCANSLYFLGEIQASLGNEAKARAFYAQARASFLQSLVDLRGSGGKWREARSLLWLGEMARIDSDYTAARSYYSQSLALQREVGDETGIALSLFNLGCVALYQGDFQEAETLFLDGLALFQKLGRQRGVVDSLAFLAALAGARGQPERAARLFGAAEALHEAHGTRISHVDRIEYDRSVGFIRARLNDALIARAWAEGRALTLEQAIKYALQLSGGQVRQKRTSSQTVKKEFGGLTEREREIATHIAQGESNREIAEALVVTERTVESHVTSILHKLGFVSRVQIRKWALEKGIATRIE